MGCKPSPVLTGIYKNSHKMAGHARGYTLSEQHCKQISEAQLRVGAAPEERQRRSERARRQHREGRLGQATWSDETRQRVRELAAKRPRPVFNGQMVAKIVELRQLGLSQHRIGAKLGISQVGVGNVLRRLGMMNGLTNGRIDGRQR